MSAYRMNIKFAGDGRFASVQEASGSALNKIKSLESYYFYYNELGNRFGFGVTEEGVSQTRQVGLIAQELQAVEPSLVKVMENITEDDYYRVDYTALNVLVLDAINELNNRADVIKSQLGMEVETYPERTATAPTTHPQYSFDSIQATPVNGVEGTEVTWRLSGTNVPHGLVVPFRFDGNFNHNDVSVPEQIDGWDEGVVGVHVLVPDGELVTEEDIAEEGQICGAVSWGNNDYVDIKLKYVSDGQIEGTEAIMMSLKSKDSLGNPLPVLSGTGTISDS